LESDEEGGGPPLPDPEMVAQMEEQLAMLQQENFALKADKSIEADKVKVEKFNAETKRLEVVAKNQLAATELGIKTFMDAQNSPDILEPEQTPPLDGGFEETAPPQIMAQ